MEKSKSIVLWVIIKKSDRSIYRDLDGRVYVYQSEKQAQDVIDNNFLFFSSKYVTEKMRLSASENLGQLQIAKQKITGIDKF